MNRLRVFLVSCRQLAGMTAIAFACFASPVAAEDVTDVTAVVSAAVKDNKLSIGADNQTFGEDRKSVV